MINLKRYLREVSFIICFFLGLTSIYTQTNQNFKILKGEIVNDSINLSGIHIINKTSGSKTITNFDGEFEIGIQKKDTIIISSVQIIPRVLVIDDLLHKQEFFKVYVDQFINELDNVVVKPHNLSGNILADMENSNVKVPINFDDVGIPGFKGERQEKIVSEKTLILTTLLLPLSGGLDIEAIYKHLSGYYKSLRNRRAWNKQDLLAVQIIEFYGVNFFTNTYSIKESEVYEFVLGGIENTSIPTDFKSSNHGLVLESFDTFFNSLK